MAEKFVFAPDSFKGSLSAARIVELLQEAALRRFPEAECVCIPVADGGEGTVDALLTACGGIRRGVTVTGPMGNPVQAEYGLIDGGATAVLEMAQSSGLTLVTGERKPLEATSAGLGEMILDALSAGAEKLLIGIGGSATNDGGMGMLSALGARFYDEHGTVLEGCGKSLGRVARADLRGLNPKLRSANLQVICDVSNPLLGKEGATAVYGPQKGVTPVLAPVLESGMARYAACLESTLERDISAFPGAGAAGGVGTALGGVLQATLRPGIDAVLEFTNFDAHLNECTLAVTGEGRLDRQSIDFGKAPVGVARRCGAKRIPLAVVVGSVGEGAEGICRIADAAIYPISDPSMPLQYAMSHAAELLTQTADRLFAELSARLRCEGQ